MPSVEAQRVGAGLRESFIDPGGVPCSRHPWDLSDILSRQRPASFCRDPDRLCGTISSLSGEPLSSGLAALNVHK